MTDNEQKQDIDAEDVAPREEERPHFLVSSSSESDSDSSEDDEPVMPPATRVRATASVPVAVSVLSTPGMLLRQEDVTAMMPEMFSSYKGPGGEEIRTLFHSMLAEYKANADDNYPTHGSIKFALFVSFIDVCCAFTPEPTEEICNVIVSSAKQFMHSVRSLFKRDVYTALSGYDREKTSVKPVAEQVKIACTILAGDFDVRQLSSPSLGEVPLHLVTTEVLSPIDKPKNIFLVLNQYASERSTAVYMYANYVRTQVTEALMARNVYIAHIFLRYFIYTVTALCHLVIHDWHYMLSKVKNDPETAMGFLSHKINSTLYSNFNDMCVYLTSKAHNYEGRISAEYTRFVEGSVAALAPVRAASSSAPAPASSVPARKESYRPEMNIPGGPPVQQEGGCIIL